MDVWCNYSNFYSCLQYLFHLFYVKSFRLQSFSLLVLIVGYPWTTNIILTELLLFLGFFALLLPYFAILSVYVGFITVTPWLLVPQKLYFLTFTKYLGCCPVVVGSLWHIKNWRSPWNRNGTSAAALFFQWWHWLPGWLQFSCKSCKLIHWLIKIWEDTDEMLP